MTDTTEKPSKTKTSFFRRLYVAYLIDTGVNTVPAIMKNTGMPKRTAQDTIAALHELEIAVEFVGATKNGAYIVKDWGPLRKEWVAINVSKVKNLLSYP